MANYLSSNEKFHVFSKSPITSTQALAQSVNKSGHTTTTGDVWSQDIPWFFTTDSQAKAIQYSANAKTNDLVDINGNVYKRKDTETAPYDAKGAFDTMWEAFTLADGVVLKNSKGEDVILVHQGVAASLLTTGNNANQSSYSAARIWALRDDKGVTLPEGETRLIPQFVQSTDKIVDGFPATGYGVSLWNNGNPISEGEANGNFIANSYAGIIQLNQDYSKPNFTANVFEYIGDKLDSSLSAHQDKLDELDDKISKISVTASGGIQGVSEDATTAGLSTKWVKLVEGEEVDAQPNEEGAYPVLTISTGTIDEEAADDKLVTGSTVKTYVDTTALAEGGSIAEYVENYVATNAKVSVNGQSATTITVAGTGVSSSDLVKIAVAEDKDTDNEIGLTLTATVDTATVTDGVVQSGDESKLVTAGDAANIAEKAVSTAATTIIDTVASRSLASSASSTQGSYVSVTTSGTIGTGLTVNVNDSALASTVSAASSAVQSVKVNGTEVKSGTEVNITAIEDVTTTAVNGVALAKDGNNVKVTVTPATYTSSTKTWTNETNVATASDVKTAISDAISGLDSNVYSGIESGGLEIDIQDGKITNAYITRARVDDNGEIIDSSGYYLVTADDAVKIATKAANDLEIPEVANATTDKAGTVKVVTGEVSKETTDASTAPYAVPTVGALAATRNAIEQRITELHKAGVSYVVEDTLPTVTAGTEDSYNGKIYLVNTGLENKVAADGSRLEYMYVNKGTEDAPQWGWEQIGTTTADLSGYAKSIKISDTKTVSADNTGALDLSSYKWISNFYNTISSAFSHATNEDSVKLAVDTVNNLWSIGVIDATAADKGLVTLTSTYNATDEVSAVTGKAVASAISGLASDAVVVKSIKMNNSATPLTPTNGQIDLGTVVTGFLEDSSSGDDGQYKEGTVTGVVRAEIDSAVNGKVQFYTKAASSTQQGVTYLYNKTATGLGSSTTAAVTESTVKSVYDTLDAKIPTNYVSSVNGKSGAITLEVGGNLSNLSDANDSQSTLWGLNVAKMSSTDGGVIKITDGFIGDNNTYGNIGSYYATTASLPTNATKVIGNFVYGSNGKVIDTIRAERMVSSFYGNTADGLTEWVTDMPNLKIGSSCFYGTSLTTFIGDLSSLEDGTDMFYDCNALTTFIGDLSSLSNGLGMFANIYRDNTCKLNSESVECILESIPDWTGDAGEHKLHIGVSTVITAESDVRQSVKDITGVELTVRVGETQEIAYKGWTITFQVAE